MTRNFNKVVDVISQELGKSMFFIPNKYSIMQFGFGNHYDPNTQCQDSAQLCIPVHNQNVLSPFCYMFGRTKEPWKWHIFTAQSIISCKHFSSKGGFRESKGQWTTQPMLLQNVSSKGLINVLNDLSLIFSTVAESPRLCSPLEMWTIICPPDGETQRKVWDSPIWLLDNCLKAFSHF